MRGGKVISIFIILLVIAFLLVYSFFPFENIAFSVDSNPSFSLENNSVKMQFYENMRFPEPEITYNIDNTCNLNKKQDMRDAFKIVENKTVLEFSELYQNGEIFVSCEEKDIIEEGMFIAGEGGPTKIVSGENFNVIFSGNILLIRDSKCDEPNVAIHELLHVLGFNHSENPQNIMYPVSKCSQTIDDQLIDEINRLYSTPPAPDLFFENASGEQRRRYLNLKLSVRNGGLIKSPSAKIIIYEEEKELKEVNLAGMDVGVGMTIDMKNIDIGLNKIEKLRIKIESEFDELSKDNNEITLMDSE